MFFYGTNGLSIWRNITSKWIETIYKLYHTKGKYDFMGNNNIEFRSKERYF